MKKTQLRNIIRESIKELMTEQIPPLGKAIMYKACGNPQAVGSGRKFTINDNGTLRDPIIGDFFCISDSPNMNNWFVTNGCIMEVVSFHWNQNATTTSTVNFLPNGCNSTNCCQGPGCNSCTVTTPTTGSLVPCYGCDNGQIINSQTQWGLTFTPNSNPQSPNFGWCGTHNGIDLYDSQNHTALSGCTGQSGCTQQDFSWSSQCSTDWLDPAPGGPNSWNNWLNARWNGYNNIGCQHIQNVINWNTQMITPTTACPAIWQGFGGGNTNTGVCWNLIQVKRKKAQIDWAGCMQTLCSC